MNTAPKKRLLFIKATSAYSPDVVQHISNVCTLLEVEFVEHVFTDIEAFKSFCETATKFDFLYIAAHGNHQCFGETSPLNTIRWADFGLALCETQAMNTGSVLFLGCCNGGLKRVALILFCNCPSITTVCGPRWKISTHELSVAIHTFLYNLLIAEEEPLCAAERTSAAVGFGFPIFDRYDLEAEITIMMNYAWLRPSDYQPTAFTAS